MKVEPQIEASWKAKLSDEFESDYFGHLKAFLLHEKSKNRIYPPGKEIFKAFDLTPFEKVKVVIIGQDPYHGEGQAEGLCFSVKQGIQIPPSLKNIYKEINRDLGCSIPVHGSLVDWALQGVLLLNAVLTVRAHQAGSHRGQGWERFTDAAIVRLSYFRENLVFLLWGSYAQAKAALIDGAKHKILTAPHPSPLSAHRGFLGCGHFSGANKYLKDSGLEPINWQIS